MRFRADIYDKVFPREKPVEHVETCVEGYTPTEEESEEAEEKEAEDYGRYC